MTLPTCNVLCTVHDDAGEPVQGATVSAKLNRFEVYNGYVVPTLTKGETNASGQVTLSLWPNQLGSTESMYSVRIIAPNGKTLKLNAVVPNQPSAQLHSIAEVPPYEGKTDGQLALDAAIAAGVTATAKAAEASASQLAAASSAATATTKANEASTHAANAANASRLTIGTVQSLPSTGTASATITGAAGSQVLNLSLVKGDTGATGPQGIQGPIGLTGPQGIQGPIGPPGGVSSFNTRTGAVTLGSSDVTNALGFTPYNATTAVNYTFTGPVDPVALIILGSPTPAQIGSTVEPVTGVFAASIHFGDNRATAITFTNLQGISQSFNPNNMSALTNLSLPALTTVVGNFSPFNMGALTNLSLPALTTVAGNFNPSSMGALTNLSLPALTTVVGNFNPSNMSALTNLSLPALTTVVGNFNPVSMSALTNLSLPAVQRIGTTITSGNAIQITSNLVQLNSFVLPASLVQVGNGAGNVTITSAALNQASVDSILVRLAALDGTNGTMAFNSRVVTITGTSSTPSATGLAAKATLVARGCTVTHN